MLNVVIVIIIILSHIMNILYSRDYNNRYKFCHSRQWHFNEKFAAQKNTIHTYLTFLSFSFFSYMFFDLYLVPFHAHTYTSSARNRLIVNEMCAEYVRRSGENDPLTVVKLCNLCDWSFTSRYPAPFRYVTLILKVKLKIMDSVVCLKTINFVQRI